MLILYTTYLHRIEKNVTYTPVLYFKVPGWVHYVIKTKKRYPTKGHSQKKETN